MLRARQLHGSSCGSTQPCLLFVPFRAKISQCSASFQLCSQRFATALDSVDCPAAGLQSGDEQGAASGSQSCTHMERGLQQQGGGGRGQLPKGRAVPMCGAVCAGGSAAQGGGGGRTRGGQAGSIAVRALRVTGVTLGGRAHYIN